MAYPAQAAPLVPFCDGGGGTGRAPAGCQWLESAPVSGSGHRALGLASHAALGSHRRPSPRVGISASGSSPEEPGRGSWCQLRGRTQAGKLLFGRALRVLLDRTTAFPSGTCGEGRSSLRKVETCITNSACPCPRGNPRSAPGTFSPIVFHTNAMATRCRKSGRRSCSRPISTRRAALGASRLRHLQRALGRARPAGAGDGCLRARHRLAA